MKRLICVLITLLLLFGCSACGSGEKESVDLTQLSSTMVYSEVYSMLSNPADYMGKSVKMTGTMSVYQDSGTGNVYYACLITDATACCSQGLEFVLESGTYPAAGEQITVVGTFETYFEGENQYCRLAEAKLL